MVGKPSNSASEDLPPETMEIVDYSTESDVLIETRLSESAHLSPDPVLTDSSAICFDTTSLSSSINFTKDKEEDGDGSVSRKRMKGIRVCSESVNRRLKESLLKESDSREFSEEITLDLLSPDPVLTASSADTSLSSPNRLED